MSDDPNQLDAPDPWQPLRRYTVARIGLGRAGDSLPTAALLAFQHDHAQARDAVHAALDTAGLAAQIAASGAEVLTAHSAADSRATYLRRPDLGRTLADDSRRRLAVRAAQAPEGYDAVFVVADGLSALAVQQSAAALLALVGAGLAERGWRLGPVVVVEQGRVAIGDEIGALLGAGQVAVLIGERPGLSVADSLGVYLTYAPRPGRTDAERNCISNIHPQGLSCPAAADALIYLMDQARRRRLTGVALKDDRATLEGG
jgi:ethanolamine ammonia-lyase small subunit